MFQKHTLSFEDTGLLNALVQDYLLKKKETEQLYTSFPDLDGYKKYWVIKKTLRYFK
ncbi:MAG: hypothetical protein IPG08_09910 [Sphingobacteriaceae bacterium]|nr:hypothetical protein [Sphingobacteriaceae bacterium]